MMRLADYIEDNATEIVDAAEAFAGTQLAGRVALDSETLRDHLPQILGIIVTDLRGSQTAQQEREKAEGEHDTPATSPMSPAQWHGQLRAKSGFSIEHLVAEYRVLRAAVLRLWSEQKTVTAESFEDMMRFNQAIDQAIAESVAYYATEAETWRNIFLGVLGHDLRGPLTAILLTSNVMSQLTTEAPLSRLTKRLVMSGERMATLLDDLLDFSRTSLGVGIRITRKDADLAQELRDEIEMLRMAWPDTQMDFDAPDGMQACVDASRLREALANLVNNAVKHGDAQARVRVTLGEDDAGIVLTVENMGNAIPAATLSTMFEPLRRGAEYAGLEDGASLGLGLFVVREVVRAHDGEVTVRSAGDSTTFTMRMPSTAPANDALID
ncbi:HAMP domain-containing histidine kinase [Luteimonas yindakuii]|uniref:sensor histidine kinase n=1 Tax=Luteimonas yindakuii TaxID=2565782 RepID=UPI0010A341CB|nr:HAMP domain-containing sensor histidine kinase [Luteimonas yindakuii]QCO66847.1 HAMP domain-containing histidine kinase [Luteimonas yindakuii]